MRNLAGKRVLITGAGHGLGKALACRCAQAGCEVVVTDVDAGRIAETVSELQQGGMDACGFPMDVASQGSVCDVRDRLHRSRGPVQILINNAGIVHGGTLLDVDLQRHHQTVQVNLLGTINVTHAFLRDLIEAEESHLVNIASAAGVIPLPHATSYSSSKWGVVGFSESIGEELRLQRHRHVKVTTVCPSFISTGLFHGVRAPWLSRTLTAEQVAQIVLKAVLRNRHTVFAPWITRFLPIGRVLLPVPLGRRVLDWLGISTSMLDWCGNQTHESSESNASIEIVPLPPQDSQERAVA